MDTLISAKELQDLNPHSIPNHVGNLFKTSFWYYTSLTTADLILNGNSFWVNNINKMNDLDELELHESEKDKIHALCFCNSKSEKIPMWYLYSGINGKGVALGLTPGNMLTLLRSVNTIEAVKEDTSEILEIGKNIELRFGWVYYRKQQEPSKILYKNKWYELSDASNFTNDNYFIKNYPWEYEKEFRLVFINHTKTTYDHLIVKIPELLQHKIKLRLAPELKIDELNKIKNLKYINKDMIPSPIPSDLKIRMDLFSRNKKNLPEYLPEYLKEEFAKSDPDITPETLNKLIQDAVHMKG